MTDEEGVKGMMVMRGRVCGGNTVAGAARMYLGRAKADTAAEEWRRTASGAEPMNRRGLFGAWASKNGSRSALNGLLHGEVGAKWVVSSDEYRVAIPTRSL